MICTICSVNSKYIHSSLAPWCLKHAAEHLCQKKHTVQICEGTVNESPERLLKRLLEQPADLYAFSCYIWNIRTVRTLVEEVKKRRPEAWIQLGGPEVSFRAAEILHEWPEVDFIISGEGEKPFAELLDSLPEIPQKLPGFAFRSESGICCTEASAGCSPLQSMDTEEYCAALHGRIAYAETSRGCPFSCAFCLSGRKDPVRFLPVEEAKELLIRLANSGTQTVKLIDRTFNCNPARAYALWEFLISEAGKRIPKGVCFHFEVGADLFDERTVHLLNAAPAGLFQIEAGMQSFHEPALEACNRKTDTKKLEANLRALIRGRNLHVHTDLIAGLPYETLTEFANSFNRAYAMQPDMLQLGFLKLLHGSELRRRKEEFGYRFAPDVPYEITESRWISSEELQLLHRVEDALERLYNSGRFRLTLEYVLKQTGWTPFSLFQTIGNAFVPEENEKISLDEYTARMFKLLRVFPSVDETKLRNAMVCDRLRTINTGRLPDCLRIPDKRLKRLAIAAKRHCGLPENSSGAAILYGEEEWIVTADYSQRAPVSGWYPLYRFPLEEFPNEP